LHNVVTTVQMEFVLTPPAQGTITQRES
jgi:hypothetical protein